MNWYDYQARNYDPAIGRWMNVDPLAEQTPNWSPNAFCNNNPLFFTDPTGMSTEANDWHRDGSGTVVADAGDTAETLATYKDISVQEARAEFNHNHIRYESVLDGGEHFYQSDRAVSSGEYGPNSMLPDAMSVSYSGGVNSIFFSANINFGIALTGNDAAFVVGGNISKGLNGGMPGIKDGFQVGIHNNYGGNVDVLEQLGGNDIGYSAALGLGGSISNTAQANGTKAPIGVNTVGVNLGLSVGAGQTNSKSYSYKLSDLINRVKSEF